MKTKNILLVFLFIVCSWAMQAQQKYEFASVTYNSLSKVIALSMNGKEYMEQNVELPKEQRSVHNQNPLFAKVNELQNQGWELINFNVITTTGQFYHSIAYLKKKKD